MGALRRWCRQFLSVERGATGVEYALVLSLMLFASLGAIKTLERNADNYYDTTSHHIGDLPSTSGSGPTGTSIPVGSSTTSTAPTTTVAPTTTTAAPTTTTTARPTTTTTAAPTTTTSTTAAPTTNTT